MEKTTAKKSTDLAQLDTTEACNKGHRFELISPADKTGTGIFITVLGKDSDVFREAIREQSDADNRRAADLRSRGLPPAVVSSAQRDANDTDLLVVATVSWEGMVLNGQPVEFNPANVKMIYTRFHWMRKQVDDHIGDVASFMTS